MDKIKGPLIGPTQFDHKIVGVDNGDSPFTTGVTLQVYPQDYQLKFPLFSDIISACYAPIRHRGAGIWSEVYMGKETHFGTLYQPCG